MGVRRFGSWRAAVCPAPRSVRIGSGLFGFVRVGSGLCGVRRFIAALATAGIGPVEINRGFEVRVFGGSEVGARGFAPHAGDVRIGSGLFGRASVPASRPPSCLRQPRVGSPAPAPFAGIDGATPPLAAMSAPSSRRDAKRGLLSLTKDRALPNDGQPFRVWPWHTTQADSYLVGSRITNRSLEVHSNSTLSGSPRSALMYGFIILKPARSTRTAQPMIASATSGGKDDVCFQPSILL